MELAEKLEKVPFLSTRKRIDRRLIYTLGLFGLIIFCLAAWLSLSDRRDASRVSATDAESRQAVESLLQPVQALKRVMTDEQVQALAVRALENPETADDLTNYLKGRIGQVSATRVFGTDLSALRPAELGPSGFALLDMALSTLAQGYGLTQIHNVLEPAQLFDSAVIKAGEETVGVVIVTLDADYLISAFNPDYSSLGFIRLTQYNGRQPLSNIREWGDASLLGEVPARIPVTGTLFRIEFPLYEQIELIGSWTALLVILTGLLCMAAAFLLFRSNQKWEEADLLRKAMKRPAAEVQKGIKYF